MDHPKRWAVVHWFIIASHEGMPMCDLSGIDSGMCPGSQVSSDSQVSRSQDHG